MNPQQFTIRRSPVEKRGVTAFTLIELIAVMAIILILAGLILGIAGHAQHDSSVRRAQTEIKAMETAIEAYKTDNGVYPRDTPVTGSTDMLNPLVDFDPGSGNKYKAASEFLYKCLSGYDPHNPTTILTKPYINFTPNQLAVASDGGGVANPTPTSPYMYIVDPFGYSYGYSTVYQMVMDSPGATPDPSEGYNPTFDLWSTAGYSAAAGHGTPSGMATTSAPAAYSSLWVKNW